MTNVVLSWLILSVSVWIISRVLPGFQVKGFGAAIGVAAIFGLLSWLIGWLLFIVIGIGTLGVGFLLAFVTRWIVNAILLKLTDALTDKLTIKSFSTALVAGLLMSALGTLGQWALSGLV
ncbi:MAG: phage holin family protein [Sorangiineae bacterium]|nr:phage holin family protein [Polyangiaceae bacterium]MEB2321192.1 phage holin family protein [Sorangiineae bacterium]